MKKISCDIIQDLLPLYADEMLSDDSIHLVEEHLKECAMCRRQWEQLRQESLGGISIQKEQENGTKNAFKKIRRKILIKRVVSVVMAIIFVLAGVRVGYYFYAEKGTYLSLEDSGLKMNDNSLYATKPYLGRLHTWWSADQHTMFLIMVDTMQAQHDYPEQNVDTLLFDFSDQSNPADLNSDGKYHTSLYEIESVYYLPEEYVNFVFDFEDKEVWEQQSAEAISKSVLLWSDTMLESSTEESDSHEKNSTAKNDLESISNQQKVLRVYNGKTRLRSLAGETWTPPKGAKLLRDGVIVDADGTAIGYDSAHPLNPDAVG